MTCSAQYLQRRQQQRTTLPTRWWADLEEAGQHPFVQPPHPLLPQHHPYAVRRARVLRQVHSLHAHQLQPPPHHVRWVGDARRYEPCSGAQAEVDEGEVGMVARGQIAALEQVEGGHVECDVRRYTQQRRRQPAVEAKERRRCVRWSVSAWARCRGTAAHRLVCTDRTERTRSSG